MLGLKSQIEAMIRKIKELSVAIQELSAKVEALENNNNEQGESSEQETENN